MPRDSYVDPTRSQASMPAGWSQRNWAMRKMLAKAEASMERPRFGWLRFWKRIYGAREVC
jgi:hypothetical protein